VADDDGTEEPEPTSPRRQDQTAKARRKREPRTSFNPEYQQGPADGKRCGARKQDGGHCTLPAGWNTDHVGYGPCAHHFGATPTGRKAGAIDMAEELSVFYGKPVKTHPIEALLDEVSRTAGHVQWLANLIGTFNVELTEEEDGKGGIRVQKVAGIPPEVEGWIKVYQSERNQLVRVAKACLDAGVNQRLVDIAEAHAEKYANGIEVILDALNLTASQRQLIPQVVPQVLRSLASAPAILEGVMPDELPGS
jgi:hypothetical protein